jgi:hypothetical protein
MNDNISLEELYYVLMSSWIYSIEKTGDEFLGGNIAYTRRLGWNATEYIIEHLGDKCDFDFDPVSGDIFQTMKDIIMCLEEVGFIKEGTININRDKNNLTISVTSCRADACKELLEKGVVPRVCLRSIVLAVLLEKISSKEFSYNLEADPGNQPQGLCISYLGEIIE